MAEIKPGDKAYEIAENPVYDPVIRALKTSDPANADTVFNPLFKQLINNTHAVKLLDEEKIEMAVEDTKNWATQVFSNPNLLINGDFQVWQRGNELEGTFSRDAYLADRWFCFANAAANKFEKVSNGIKATATIASSTRIGQYIESAENYINRTVTLSFKVSGVVGNVNVYSTTSGRHTYIFNCAADGVYSSTYIMPENAAAKTGVFLQTEAAINNTFTVEWVKLELGSFATPFVPRSYGEELALCQRYYEIGNFSRVAVGSRAVDNTRYTSTISFMMSKRVGSNIALIGDINLINNVLLPANSAGITTINYQGGWALNFNLNKLDPPVEFQDTEIAELSWTADAEIY